MQMKQLKKPTLLSEVELQETAIKALTKTEIDTVNGGIGIFAPVVWGILADTGFYGAISTAFGAGFALGTALRNTSSGIIFETTDSPTTDAVIGGNLGA